MANKTYSAAKSTMTGDRVNLYTLDTLPEGGVTAATDFSSADPIAFGQSCSVDVTADTIDSSNKMGGNWKNTRVGQLGWTVQSDALYSTDPEHNSFEKLLRAYTERKAIGVCLGIVAETEEEFEAARANGFKLDASDKTVMKGTAYITAMNANMGTGGEVISYSVTLTGDGPLYVGGTAGSAA